jgi:hypothetical protein
MIATPTMTPKSFWELRSAGTIVRKTDTAVKNSATLISNFLVFKWVLLISACVFPVPGYTGRHSLTSLPRASTGRTRRRSDNWPH